MKLATVLKICVFLRVLLIPAVTNAWILRYWNHWREGEEHESPESTLEEDDIDAQLKAVRCPARVNLNLLDYWKCLWHTSITVEGIQQHRKLIEEQQKQLNGMKRPTLNVSRQVSRKARRTKRALSLNVLANLQNLNGYVYFVTYHFHYYPGHIKKCQYEHILPGTSLFKFYLCVLAIEKENGPTPPPIDNSYDSREFKTLSKADTNLDMDLIYHFDRMPNEPTNTKEFAGADPYLEEQYSKSRYIYDNLKMNQRQPGWSYTGNDRPSKWPYLELKKFYIPTKSGVDLNKVNKLADLAQSYPGIGEITGNLDDSKLFTPIDYDWKPDRGYYIYTRFLLPLLTKKDVDYYQLKGDIDDRNYTKDADVLQGMIDGIDKFLNDSFLPLGRYLEFVDEVPPVPEFRPASYYPKTDDIPLNQVYRAFFEHYFNYDYDKFIADRAAYENTDRSNVKTHQQFEAARLILRSYAYAVRLQIFCMQQMVIKYDYRRKRKDKDDVVNEALENCEDIRPPIGPNVYKLFISLPPASDLYELLIKAANPISKVGYKPTRDLLVTLYKMYFDRKESRQRYSLPFFPHEFPICKHNEPSPIDIHVKSGVQSSLRSYTFGDAAYRLQRFIMSFPMDGSNLRIHRGERLDDSSIRISGGAVKGQNLTFQQMNIRFSHSWKVDGSEHRFDGKGAPMELQMIFTIDGSADAIRYFQVLARVQNQLFQFREKLVIILAVLVDVLETDSNVLERIRKDKTNQDPFLFEPLAQAAYHFRKQEEKEIGPYRSNKIPRGYISLDPVFRFIDFIPQKMTKFYTYRGSLSWPPCFPYVLWSVFKQRLYMSKRQFDEFTKIPAIGTSDNNFASDNIREIGDIWVEEENDPNVDYTQKQAMKHARTVERLILEGEHDPAAIRTRGVVADDIYFLDDTSGAPAPFFFIPDSLKSSLAFGVLALIYSNYYFSFSFGFPFQIEL